MVEKLLRAANYLGFEQIIILFESNIDKELSNEE